MMTGYHELGRLTGGSKDPCSSMPRGASRCDRGSRLRAVEEIHRPVPLTWQQCRHSRSTVCSPSRPRRSPLYLTPMPDDTGWTGTHLVDDHTYPIHITLSCLKNGLIHAMGFSCVRFRCRMPGVVDASPKSQVTRSQRVWYGQDRMLMCGSQSSYPVLVNPDIALLAMLILDNKSTASRTGLKAP